MTMVVLVYRKAGIEIITGNLGDSQAFLVESKIIENEINIKKLSIIPSITDEMVVENKIATFCPNDFSFRLLND